MFRMITRELQDRQNSFPDLNPLFQFVEYEFNRNRTPPGRNPVVI